MPPIDPNSAFTRTVFDLPTPVALELDAVVKASGKAKKTWLTDVVAKAVKEANEPTKSVRRSKKR